MVRWDKEKLKERVHKAGEKVRGGVNQVRYSIKERQIEREDLGKIRAREEWEAKQQYEKDKVKIKYEGKRAQEKARASGGLGGDLFGAVFGSSSPAPSPGRSPSRSRRRGRPSEPSPRPSSGFDVNSFVFGDQGQAKGQGHFDMFGEESGGSVPVFDVDSYVYGSRKKR